MQKLIRAIFFREFVMNKLKVRMWLAALNDAIFAIKLPKSVSKMWDGAKMKISFDF